VLTQFSDVESASDAALNQLKTVFAGFTNTIFSVESITVLFIALTSAVVLGRIIAYLLRRLVSHIGTYADRSQSLQTVNRLRRYETIIIISIAIIRTGLVIFALYLWWILIHPGQQPTALIGASALLAIVIGGALSPALRDISAGSLMMAEQWYAVGDHVRIEPFGELQGVVERVTLRATRVRGLNGEVIWINNQNIQAVRILPKGVISMALEVFVTDPDRGAELIDSVNRRLPTGALLVVNPLKVMSTNKVGDDLWHITAIAETAPGREWIIQNYAIDVMKEIDENRKLKLLATDPVARFADSEAERKFSRAIGNSRKVPVKRRPFTERKLQNGRKQSPKK
jgi:hypothetical protein